MPGTGCGLTARRVGLAIAAGVLVGVTVVACNGAPPDSSATSTGGSQPASEGKDGDGPAKTKDIRKVDWLSATIEFPKSTHQGSWENHCMTGTLTFKDDGDADEEGSDAFVSILPDIGGVNREPVYGDMTGDGTDEAVIYLSCSYGANQRCDGVVVVGTRADKLVVLDYAYRDKLEDKDGCIGILDRYRLDGRQLVTGLNSTKVITYRYEWNGSKLVRTGA